MWVCERESVSVCMQIDTPESIIIYIGFVWLYGLFRLRVSCLGSERGWDVPL